MGASESDFIQVIDTRAYREVATVGASGPWMILADPVDSVVYGLNPYVTPASAARKIIGSKWIELDTRTLGVASFVDGPGDARAIAWHAGSDANYRRVYVATEREVGGALTIYTPPNAGSTRLGMSAELRVGDYPVGIAVDSATHRVYVASNGDKKISVVLQGR
jgi:DNA-binding beta-propeller fold protein YncE